MPQFRFNHVFVGLLLLSLTCAFVIPGRFVEPFYRRVPKLFVPISRPVASVAAWFSGKVNPAEVTDGRPDDDIRAENDALKVEITALQGQVDRLARLSAERAQLGRILELCTVVPVIGPDAGVRETLNVQQTDGSLNNGQAVVYPGGLVGRVERSGAMVRLITDKGSRPVTVVFGRVEKDPDGQHRFKRVPVNKTLLYGAGNNQLIARQSLSVREIEEAALKVGDWAVLFEDADFPPALAYLRVGQVTDVRRSITAPLYADVYLKPMNDLSELREVMVVTKK
jgi:hypothetical protein